jgi:hypothetical protein
MALLRGLLMIEDLPTGRLAVYLFLEMIALGFALEAVNALMREDWLRGSIALILGIAFMVLGVKSWQIITKFSSLVDWQLWGKRFILVARVGLVLVWIAIGIGGYYTWTRAVSAWHSISHTSQETTKPLGVSSAPTTPSSVQDQPNAPPRPRPSTHKKSSDSGQQIATSPPSQVPTAPIQRLDWHDKQNWRQHLHTGMTRTEVRALFGEPEKMSVMESTEFWGYGYGAIYFDVADHSDGSLFFWSEPPK